jgi:nickel-dependent lactate racemase
MDDGGKLDYNKNTNNKSVVLNTHSFTNLEVESMSEQLSSKFNLLCEIRSNKDKNIIVIKDLSYQVFYNLINPYLIQEMRYKLPYDYNI